MSSPLPFWETPMSPAPHLDAAMARCGALPPRAMMMTANGASVLTKVWIVFLAVPLRSGLFYNGHENERQRVNIIQEKLCSWHFLKPSGKFQRLHEVAPLTDSN